MNANSDYEKLFWKLFKAKGEREVHLREMGCELALQLSLNLGVLEQFVVHRDRKPTKVVR